VSGSWRAPNGLQLANWLCDARIRLVYRSEQAIGQLQLSMRIFLRSEPLLEHVGKMAR
jgi:hypothetical protein